MLSKKTMKKALKPNKKTKDPEPQAVAQISQWIYIRVLQSDVDFSVDPAIASDPSVMDLIPSARHLYLIQGSIDEIGRYAGTTVDWIIKVAHSICDPSGAGQVYTHPEGMSYDWYERDRNADWRQVVRGDTLLPGIYEFVTTSPITLSKISDRQSHSMTSMGSESSATTFRRHLELRDGGCAVTQSSYSLIASHLIPKRMGTGGAKEVVTRFVGAQKAQDIHRFHPSIGVLLASTLDTWVDHYTLGFYHDVVRKL
jgi:hypothetical protein